MLRLGIITALGGAAGAIVLLLSPTADGGNRLGQGVALFAVAHVRGLLRRRRGLAVKLGISAYR